MSNLSKYIIFKPVPGGYVYRIPNAWVFGEAHIVNPDRGNDFHVHVQSRLNYLHRSAGKHREMG